MGSTREVILRKREPGAQGRKQTRLPTYARSRRSIDLASRISLHTQHKLDLLTPLASQLPLRRAD